jgi:hypothetical protein
MAGIGGRTVADSEDPRARHRGHLDDGLRDLAVHAADENGVEGLDAARLAQSLVGGDEGHADRARLLEAE